MGYIDRWLGADRFFWWALWCRLWDIWSKISYSVMSLDIYSYPVSITLFCLCFHGFILCAVWAVILLLFVLFELTPMSHLSMLKVVKFLACFLLKKFCSSHRQFIHYPCFLTISKRRHSLVLNVRKLLKKKRNKRI